MADYPPLKNSAYKLIFPIFDASGNLLSAAGSLAARVSKDGTAFAVATNAVAEIGTDGVYALDLTATEMNADQIAVRVTSGGKPVYGLIHTVVRQHKDLAFPNVSGRGMDVDATGGVETGVVAIGAISSLSFAAGAIDAAALAANALGAAELAADAAEKIADALLARNVAGGSNAGRLVKEALYVLRNRVAIAAGTMTVYGVDDATPAFTAAVTTAAGNPISEVNPA